MANDLRKGTVERMRKRGGLGEAARGGAYKSNALDALVGGAGREELLEVEPGKLAPSPWQTREKLDPEALEELVSSIRAHGILEPILARRKADGSLELLAGHRRKEAARIAKLERVPVRVLDVGDTKARAVTLTENLARSDLSAWEEAQGMAALRSALKEGGEKATRDRLVELTGRSAGTVSTGLRIADQLTPAVLEAAKVDRQVLTKLPKALLENASRGGNIAARAGLLAAAVGARIESRGGAQAEGGRAPAPVAPARQKKAPGRPSRPYAMEDRLESSGRLSLTLRQRPETLEPEDAAELLERLEPLVERLRKQALRTEATT